MLGGGCLLVAFVSPALPIHSLRTATPLHVASWLWAWMSWKQRGPSWHESCERDPTAEGGREGGAMRFRVRGVQHSPARKPSVLVRSAKADGGIDGGSPRPPCAFALPGHFIDGTQVTFCAFPCSQS